MADANEQIEYELSIMPTDVIRLLTENTEPSHFSTAFFIEQNYKQEFESVISGNTFKLYRKPRVRRGTNSYIPWLCGQVTPTEYGSIVRVWFELDKWVRLYEKINSGGLYLFTAIVTVLFVMSAINGILEIGTMVGVIVGGFLWLVRYIIKKRGEELAKRDRIAGLEFLDNLFASVRLAAGLEDIPAKQT